MEENKKYESDKGTPQGGLISPILANVYLHYVLDLWIEKDIKKRYHGEVFEIRFADVFVVCFEFEKEAKQFLKELKERLAKFGLEMEETKSKIVKFGKTCYGNKETFDFLGFTHINDKTKTGHYKVVHKTSKKKIKAKKIIVKEWIKENRHIAINKLIEKLNIKLLGHYRYYGISDNSDKLQEFMRYITVTLFKQLRRRGQKHKLTWEKYLRILKYNPIVQPKIYISLYN